MWLAIAFAVALQGPPAPAPEGLADGITHYRSLEFEKATIVFQRLALEPDLSPQNRADVFLWLGLSYGQLGDLDSARQAFQRAVLNDVDRPAPPDAPPELAKILEEERAKVKPKPKPKPSPAPVPLAKPVVAPPRVEPVPAPETATPWGAIGAGLGAVALGAAATVLGVMGAAEYERANDIDVPAGPALEAYDASLLYGSIAVAAGTAAVAAAGTGIALVLLE